MSKFGNTDHRIVRRNEQESTQLRHSPALGTDL